ncbi:double-stranded RNA-binding protein 3-like [Impatiens glandulifera]|uniref:double-stranded RNA-binding protein 3-like n=1 Tax=Impatiens glandulifera TaxID=253017 RepID=UPI001FB0E2EB|nr:double-stranded RNA-binding protein 3-like [Impatiens glandulifera]XP_047321579.1 double-stranded RNA-binding protein 3-like [Impatiens glandulifera]
MYKNQLQELAQRSCFNLPSYSCIREGPDHAPRFKAAVNFKGETFESPSFYPTLRQAEHAAAEIALNTLANKGPSKALAAKILDETGVYKNLLQETAHRAGLNLPVYTTVRSGLGHATVFSCTIEIAGMSFSGEPAKTKKQAQKNSALVAWSSLKQLAQQRSTTSSSSCPSSDSNSSEEQDKTVIARLLLSLQPTDLNRSKQHEDREGKLLRSLPVRKDPPITQKPSSSPARYQNWAYSNPSQETLLMYQLWQQAHFPRQMLAYSIPPTSPPPHVLHQQMHPLFHPQMPNANNLNLPGISVSSLIPSIYPTRNVIHNPTTLQEMEDRKGEESPSSGLSPIIDAGKCQLSSFISGRGSGPIGMHSTFMAPPVQVRSIIPVCSPLPLTRPSQSQDGQSSRQENDDYQAATVELSKIHI